MADDAGTGVSCLAISRSSFIGLLLCACQPQRRARVDCANVIFASQTASCRQSCDDWSVRMATYRYSFVHRFALSHALDGSAEHMVLSFPVHDVGVRHRQEDEPWMQCPSSIYAPDIYAPEIREVVGDQDQVSGYRIRCNLGVTGTAQADPGRMESMKASSLRRKRQPRSQILVYQEP
jgi:hypothetical protein